MAVDLSSGSVRSAIVFVIAFGFLWVLNYLLGQIGINFFGEAILIFIGATWAAYWVWKKTELGRY